MQRMLFGIKNCDTVRRARKDLDAHGISYQFRDLRADKLDEQTVRAWVDALGIDTVLNRRGTTWRQLKASVATEAEESALISLMVEHPTLIKRPVFQRGDAYRIGYPRTEADDTLAWFNERSAR